MIPGEDNTQNLPLLGERLPEIHANTTQGRKVIPRDYKESWVVLFSHPADFTPVCTTEFVAFAKRNEEFRKLNTYLVGLSLDQVFSHIKWIDWIRENFGTEVPFPVIADDSSNIARKLGMLHPGKGSNTVRAVFILDPNGFVRLILYYPQEVGRKIDEIIRVLKALQAADTNDVSLPADWPENELIGDKGIIPPAVDVKTADKRRDLTDCYDWWFCYKDIQ
jgi:peroxiredoxin (alkyl hydroperoxide reductase subunit C)